MSRGKFQGLWWVIAALHHQQYRQISCRHISQCLNGSLPWLRPSRPLQCPASSLSVTWSMVSTIFSYWKMNALSDPILSSAHIHDLSHHTHGFMQSESPSWPIHRYGLAMNLVWPSSDRKGWASHEFCLINFMVCWTHWLISWRSQYNVMCLKLSWIGRDTAIALMSYMKLLAMLNYLTQQSNAGGPQKGVHQQPVWLTEVYRCPRKNRVAYIMTLSCLGSSSLSRNGLCGGASYHRGLSHAGSTSRLWCLLQLPMGLSWQKCRRTLWPGFLGGPSAHYGSPSHQGF
jgi:hypothetical protein